MNRSAKFKLTRGLPALGGLAALALLLSSCGGSSGTANAQANGGTSHHTSHSTVIETKSGPLGTYLTDSRGYSLYMFKSDSSSASSCNGQCAMYWPPLQSKSAVTVSGGASKSLLGTITRTDGTKQVTYGGYPLYYFALDTSPGQTTGEGSTNFGAPWWLLAPNGKPITSKTTPSTPAYGAGSGGGY